MVTKKTPAKKEHKHHAAGKRKRAIARVTLKPGSGRVIINNVGLDHYGNRLNRARIQEPIILAGALGKKYDFMVRAMGGGPSGQADAIRLAIGRALAKQDPKLRNTLMEYDRLLIVADVRRKEVSKPNSHGKARAKRQKSYR